MTFPPLLLEMQHPVWNFAARSTHNIHNGSELPGIILRVKCNSFSCNKECTPEPWGQRSGGLSEAFSQTSLTLLPRFCTFAAQHKHMQPNKLFRMEEA